MDLLRKMPSIMTINLKNNIYGRKTIGHEFREGDLGW